VDPGELLKGIFVVLLLLMGTVGGVALAVVTAMLLIVGIPVSIIKVFHGLEFLYKHRWRVLELTVAVTLLTGWLSYRWYFYWDPWDVPESKEMIRYVPLQVSFIYDRNGEQMI